MRHFILPIIITAFLLISNHSRSQNVKQYEFGKGLRYMAKDSSFYMKFSTRIQNRYDGIYEEDRKPAYQSRFFVKRGRIKFDGFVLNPKVVYKFEYDVVGGYVRDGWVKWNFYKNLSIQYGLGKLPGNRERVVSSQKLQFVDRSQVNDAFNIDRDMGFIFYHHFKLGKIIFKEALAYTDGRGIQDATAHDGNSTTARLEMLPFGKFTNKGDMFYADLERETKPKLMIAGVYNYNYKAIDTRGQNGLRLSDTRDLGAFFADLMFKYRGINIYGEYAYKESTTGSPVVETDSLGNVIQSFYTGHGYNAQIGYLFKNNVELSGRYSVVIPEKITQNDEVYEYTLGLSKYIVEHSLKIQSDISYRDNNVILNDFGERIIFRFQVELSF